MDASGLSSASTLAQLQTTLTGRAFSTSGGPAFASGTALTCSLRVVVGTNTCGVTFIDNTINNCTSDGTNVAGVIGSTASWTSSLNCIFTITRFDLSITSPSSVAYSGTMFLSGQDRLLGAFPSVASTTTVNIMQSSSASIQVKGSNFPIDLSESPVPQVFLSSSCATQGPIPCSISTIVSGSPSTITCTANLSMITGDAPTGCRITAKVVRIGLDPASYSNTEYVSIAPPIILSPTTNTPTTIVATTVYVNLSIPVTSAWSSALTFTITTQDRIRDCSFATRTSSATWLSPGYIGITPSSSLDGCILTINISRSGISTSQTVMLVGTYIAQPLSFVALSSTQLTGQVFYVAEMSTPTLYASFWPNDMREFTRFNMTFSPDTNLAGPALCPPALTDPVTYCFKSGSNLRCTLPGVNSSADGCIIGLSATRFQDDPLTTDSKPMVGYIIAGSVSISQYSLSGVPEGAPRMRLVGTNIPRGGDNNGLSLVFGSSGTAQGSGSTCSYSSSCISPQWSADGRSLNCSLSTSLPSDGCGISITLRMWNGGSTFMSGGATVLRNVPVVVATPTLEYYGQSTTATEANYRVTLENSTQLPYSSDTFRVTYTVEYGAPCSGTEFISCSSGITTHSSTSFSCNTGRVSQEYDPCPFNVTSITRYGVAGIAGQQIGILYKAVEVEQIWDNFFDAPTGGNLTMNLTANSGVPLPGDIFTVTLAYVSNSGAALAVTAPTCPTPIISGRNVICYVTTRTDVDGYITARVRRRNFNMGFGLRVARIVRQPQLYSAANTLRINTAQLFTFTGYGLPISEDLTSWFANFTLSNCSTPENNRPIPCTGQTIVSQGNSFRCTLNATGVFDETCSISATVTRHIYTSPSVVIGRIVGLPPVAPPVAPAPVSAPRAPPVSPPVNPPVLPPRAPPAAPPANPPAASPVVPPIAPPVAVPSALPVAAPVALPVAAPRASPVSAPVAAPTASPASNPSPSPVQPPPQTPSPPGNQTPSSGQTSPEAAPAGIEPVSAPLDGSTPTSVAAPVNTQSPQMSEVPSAGSTTPFTNAAPGQQSVSDASRVPCIRWTAVFCWVAATVFALLQM